MVQPKAVGTLGQRGPGELCCSGCEGTRVSIKNRARAFKVTAREGNGNWGQEEKTFQLLECILQTDCFFFQAEKLKSCIARACAFSSSAGHPLSGVMCTFENYIYLESCNSGMSGTDVLMCQWEPSTLVHNDWSDFCCAFGKCRLEKITEGTTSRVLIETTFFSVCKERLLPSLLSVSPTPPLLPQHCQYPQLCQHLTLLADIDVNVLTWFCLLAGSKECHAWWHVF